jgi:hypothetical protein
LISPAALAKDGVKSRPYANQLYVKVTPRDAAQVRQIWESGALVVEPHDPRVAVHRMSVTPDALERLRAAGLEAKIEHTDFQDLIDASYAKWESLSTHASALPSFFDKVQDLAPIFAFLDDQAAGSGGRAKVSVLGKGWQNNEVKVVRISSAPDDGDRATIFVTSTHHAYEWLVPMIGTGLVWALVNQYGADSNVKKIVDNLNVYIIPVLNPDSFVKTRTGDRMRRTNQNPSCAAGVDLNRNWPSVGWGQGVGSCGSQFYPGTSALSEPETQAAKALADKLKKLVWYLDLHTQSAQVMIPYAWTMTKPASYARAKEFAQQYGQIIGLPARDGYELAQGSGGGALDYFQELLDARNGMSHVVEERGVAYDPPADGVPPYVEKNIAAFVTIAAKLADENPAGGGTGGAGGSGGDGGGAGSGGRAGGAGNVDAGRIDDGSSGEDAGGDGAGGGSAGGMGAGGGGGSVGGAGAHGGIGGASSAAAGGSAPQGFTASAAGCSCRVERERVSPRFLLAAMAILGWVVRRSARRR